MAELVEITEGRLLGFEEVASYLHVNGATIRRLIERGVLQPVRIPTLRRVLFDRQDLDHLIETGKVTPPELEARVAE